MQTEAARSDDFARLGSGGGVARFTSAGPRQALAQLEASPALSEGKICLVGLDAVRERMGPRWDARRDMVLSYAEQTLRRQIGARGLFVRISDTGFLVALPDLSPLAGQAYCLNCLRDILTHFLGDAQMSDIVVHQVTSIRDGALEAQQLDVTRVEAEAKAERAQAPAIPARVISPDHWTPFVSHDGRNLRASSQLEPVFQLKSYTRIGYRMTRQVRQLPGDTPLTAAEQRTLAGVDIERIDFAILARGLNRLQGADDREPSLILPVSYASLSSARGRATLAEFFRAAQASVQRGLICEVCDIDGVPPSALLAATSLIRPFCLYVIGRVSSAPNPSWSGLKDAHLEGFSVECPRGVTSDEGFGGFAGNVLAALKPISRAVMFFGVPGPRQAAIASLFGATHASFGSGDSGA
jgi:hypothetical protein